MGFTFLPGMTVYLVGGGGPVMTVDTVAPNGKVVCQYLDTAGNPHAVEVDPTALTTLPSGLAIDSAGIGLLGGMLGGVLPNPTFHPNSIVATNGVGSPYLLKGKSVDSGALCFNAGAGAITGFQLPPTVNGDQGLFYWFGCIGSFALRVTASTGDRIQFGINTTTADTGHVDFQSNGASGLIYNYAYQKWIVMTFSGTVTLTAT